jgi:hypothetical protein
MLHVLQMLLGAIDTPGSFVISRRIQSRAAGEPASKSRKANGTLDAVRSVTCTDRRPARR